MRGAEMPGKESGPGSKPCRPGRRARFHTEPPAPRTACRPPPWSRVRKTGISHSSASSSVRPADPSSDANSREPRRRIARRATPAQASGRSVDDAAWTELEPPVDGLYIRSARCHARLHVRIETEQIARVVLVLEQLQPLEVPPVVLVADFRRLGSLTAWAYGNNSLQFLDSTGYGETRSGSESNHRHADFSRSYPWQILTPQGRELRHRAAMRDAGRSAVRSSLCALTLRMKPGMSTASIGRPNR